jgi:hypothetical protein
MSLCPDTFFQSTQELADAKADWDFELWQQERNCHIMNGKSKTCKVAKARRWKKGVF